MAPRAERARTLGGQIFETSVDFEPVKKISLDERGGDVELRGVEFTISAAKD